MNNIKELSTPSDLGINLSFKDGTKYMRMPNGELRRMSPKAYQIRKQNRKQNRKQVK
jgi:hypothetical protein